MQPFTPENKKNTVAWLAARSDGENYGTLLAYYLPKEKLTYGPMQVENRIEQDTAITEQFALWGRGGSTVIRGNLLMIPIEDSFLYVEPIFLQGAAGGVPELKRVIVATGDSIAMEQTLDEALDAVFSMAPPEVTPPPDVEEPPGEELPGEIAELAESIAEHWIKAQEYAGEGDWAAYGEEMDALEAEIERLVELTAE